MRFLAGLFLFTMVPLLAQSHVEARIIADRESVQKDESFHLGIHLKMKDHWHTYWENPGFAGLPTKWELEAVPGLEIGALEFPVPKRFVDDAGYVTYGFDDEALLIARATYSGDAKVIELKGSVNWLECKQSCIPGRAEVSLTLQVGESKPAHAKIFQKYRQLIPESHGEGSAFTYATKWSFETTAWRGTLTLDGSDAFPAKTKSKDVKFFPLATDYAELKNYKVETKGKTITIDLEFEPFEESVPDDLALNGVVHFGGASLKPTRLSLYPEVSATKSLAPVGTLNDPAVAEAPPTAATGIMAYSFRYVLLIAFLGGMILNLMPCVLPVLSLKVFAVVQEAGGNYWHRVKLGWVYTLGIMICFFVFSLFFVAGKAAGTELGIGFQFQSPAFVIGMSALIFIMALSFFGVFHIEAPNSDALYGLSQKQGVQGAFFQGALMTLLSTPCTAPFLGSAYAWALSQPPLVIVVVFQIIAFGLAFPYLMLCYFPALLRFLPKPGPWMEYFKVFLGFLLMGTVVWLFSILIDLSGKDGVLGSLTLLLGLAFACWIFGQTFHGVGRRGGLLLSSLAVAISVFLGMFVVFDIRDPFASRLESEEALRLKLMSELESGMTLAADGSSPSFFESLEQRVTTEQKIAWIPYSPDALEYFRKKNRLVFLDFTASWCLTCKANEKLVINTKKVRSAFADHKVVTIKVDYTNKDEEITRFIQSFNRAGVPLYVFYPGQGDPILLPEAISTGILLDGLGEANAVLTSQSALSPIEETALP
ncbi:Thioredoxin family protein [Sulfidibacter corallicola]|uniref:Thioredoxin family protein n=1 Tax=Sulfidibacter corallicola TaxID=2818388 RepID=A0A8A4TUQ7_SULCO|nr:thioredoxin family protein [Sulfidibacter corallicola]QTD52851.1 thioredoxin family protein [Sulfidibacter corallicola]